MMLQARDGGPGSEAMKRWLDVGGDKTLASYSPFDDTGTLADVPDEHWAFLENHLLPYYETSKHLFVHAGAYPDVPLNEQPDFMLYWEEFADPPAHESGKMLVCGHTPQKAGMPRCVGHAACIDTWACGRGWLTCLEVETGQYWRANQAGQVRSDWLEPIE
jgi:serine/threonine protein phosphatase 1